MKRLLLLCLLALPVNAQVLIHGANDAQRREIEELLTEVKPPTEFRALILLRQPAFDSAKLAFHVNRNCGSSFSLAGRIYMDAEVLKQPFKFDWLLSHEWGHFSSPSGDEDAAERNAKSYRVSLKHFRASQEPQ